MYLQALFAKMGIANEMQAKATQSTPGIPVAHYVATGAVELGFQQIGELIEPPRKRGRYRRFWRRRPLARSSGKTGWNRHARARCCSTNRLNLPLIRRSPFRKAS